MTRAWLALPFVAACFAQPTAPDPTTMGGPVHRLTAGGKHACWISDSDIMYCWGDNTYGQLGVPASVMPYSATPVPVGGDNPSDGWQDLAAGDNHTCGIIGGAVVCFGADDHHQVQGDSAPHQVALPGGIPKRVFAGASGTCMLDDAGALYCWGHVDETVGNFAEPAQLMPTGVATPWSEIAIADDHACAIRGDFGSTWCWGKDDQMQLGTADRVSHSAADAQGVQGGSYAHLGVDFGTSCGVDVTGSLACWGGAAPTNDVVTPYVAIDDTSTTGRTWNALAVESGHVCAITNGALYCYGDDTTGDVGHGEFAGFPGIGSPVTSGATEVALGTGFTCMTAGDGVRCWGANVYGELGSGTTATARDPVQVDLGGGAAVSVVAGYGHTCAQLSNNDVLCWGDNRAGQAVPGGPSFVPTPMRATTGVDHVAAGASHTCARDATTTTRVRCWGDSTAMQAPPVVTLGATVTAVQAGGNTTCAIAGGNVSCWGDVPGDGQQTPHAVGSSAGVQSLVVGSGVAGWVSGSTTFELFEFGQECSLNGGAVTSPANVTGRSDVTLPFVALSQGGAGHGCEMTDLDIECWGANNESQAYAMPRACVGSPIPVAAPAEGWIQPADAGTLAVAGNHSCAITTVGSAYCWGDNTSFAFGGDAPAAVVANPTHVGKLGDHPWVAISTGPFHTCAITSPNNDVYCWGLNRYGEVGNGQMFVAKPPASAINPP